MLSKSSWSLCSSLSVVMLLSAGCSLLQLAGVNPQTTPAYEGGLLVRTPKGVFWSGRQVRDLTQKIRLIIPPAPKGLSLEAAQKKEADMKQIGESMIPLFFLYASDPDDILPLKEAEYTHRATQAYALQGGKIADIEKEFQLPIGTVGGVPYVNRYIFLKPNDSDVVYVVPNRFMELHWTVRYSVAGVYLDHPIQGRAGFFGMSLERPLRINNLTKQPISSVSALTPARNKALYDFRRDFTILMPDVKMQEQLPELRHSFLNPDGSLSTDKAAKSKEQFWKLYLQKFTTVKEAQSDDPSFKDYVVELNIDLFCAYGRQVKDLLSK